MNASGAGPVQAGERVLALDVLRGLALFGILVVNTPWFFTSWWITAKLTDVWPAPIDRAALALVDLAFAGKFNSLFSFLFGVGFALQLARLEARGARAARTYARRLAGLAAMGLAHAVLVWTGDVLLVYAELGLVLLVLRRAPERVLLALFVVAVLAPVALSASSVVAPGRVAEERAEAVALQRAAEAAYGRGTYTEATRQRARELAAFYTQPDGYGFYLQIMATMLLGVVVGRRGWLAAPEAHAALFRRALAITGPLGAVTASLHAVLETRLVPYAPTWLDVAHELCFCVQRPALMIAYASGVLLLLARSARWLAALAPVGRMALTGYVAQSLVMTTIAYGYGLGLWGRVRPAWGFVAAVVLYGAQLVACRAWLARFSMGPLERAWRFATYGRAG